MIRVASAIIIREGTEHIENLILLTRKVGRELFTLPGGKLEEGEGFLEAVIREIREEHPKSGFVPGKFYKWFTGVTPHSKRPFYTETYFGKFQGPETPAAEIEEIIWRPYTFRKVSKTTKHILHSLHREGYL